SCGPRPRRSRRGPGAPTCWCAGPSRRRAPPARRGTPHGAAPHRAVPQRTLAGSPRHLTTPTDHSLAESAEEGRDVRGEGPEGLPAVRDRVLLLRGELGGGVLLALGQEQRVVAEAARAAPLAQQGAEH